MEGCFGASAVVQHVDGWQELLGDLIASIDQVGQKLADYLSIAESALTTLVQRRPPSDSDLSKADQETLGVMALPIGLASFAATYQDALRGKFTDQVEDIHPLTD